MLNKIHRLVFSRQLRIFWTVTVMCHKASGYCCKRIKGNLCWQ